MNTLKQTNQKFTNNFSGFSASKKFWQSPWTMLFTIFFQEQFWRAVANTQVRQPNLCMVRSNKLIWLDVIYSVSSVLFWSAVQLIKHCQTRLADLHTHLQRQAFHPSGSTDWQQQERFSRYHCFKSLSISLHNIQVIMYQTGTPAYVTSRKVKMVAGFALCLLSSIVYLCWCWKLQLLQVACYMSYKYVMFVIPG